MHRLARLSAVRVPAPPSFLAAPSPGTARPAAICAASIAFASWEQGGGGFLPDIVPPPFPSLVHMAVHVYNSRKKREGDDSENKRVTHNPLEEMAGA